MTNAWEKLLFPYCWLCFMGESVCDVSVWRLVRVWSLMGVSSRLIEWEVLGHACCFYACVFPTWPATAAGHSLWVVWAHLPRWTRLNPHPPTHEQWQVLPAGWVKGPCVALELNLGREHRNSLTWGRDRPGFPPRQNLDISALATQSWWRQQSQSGFLFSSAFCDRIQGYRKLPSRPRVSGSNVVWTHLSSRAGELTQAQALDGKVPLPVWWYRKEQVRQDRVKASLMFCFKIYLQKG